MRRSAKESDVSNLMPAAGGVGAGKAADQSRRLAKGLTKAPNDKVTLEAKLLSSILNMHLLPDRDALVAQEALERLGCLGAVFRMPPEDLFSDPAFGSAAVANLHFVRQLIYKETYEPLRTSHIFENFDKLIHYLLLRIGRSEQEQARLLSLNARSQLIDDKVIATGNTASVGIDIKTVIGSALRNYATSIVLVHNHPSGDPRPSGTDMEFTRSVFHACSLVGIYLADHVIVAGTRWYSFRQCGWEGL